MHWLGSYDTSADGRGDYQDAFLRNSAGTVIFTARWSPKLTYDANSGGGGTTTDYVDTIKDELQADIDTKQGILTAGTGISIDENGVVHCIAFCVDTNSLTVGTVENLTARGIDHLLEHRIIVTEIVYIVT